MSPRKPSDFTCTDQFCGAGGSSIGAARAGVRLTMALNHWKLAIETHATNFPDADHDCTDVSACNPRRYPSTDILITSPECTNHSLAKGKNRKDDHQRDIFRLPDPSDERSRATMWDVPRFAEYHDYRLIIVENVIDARYWVMWDSWLHAMDALGYAHRCVYLNSMFAHPTPQSRDRMYVVFWKAKNRAPDLDICPPAWCPRCERNVESVQAWKPGRAAGRYRRQYAYACPICATVVQPYYYAALNAIDWTLPAERIRDRKRPLKERTMARIKYGLEKYGRIPIMVTANMTSGVGCRSRSIFDPGWTQPGSAIYGLAHRPVVVETGQGHENNAGVRDSADAFPTQTARQSLGLAMPFLVTAGSRETGPVPMDGVVPTLTGSDRLALAGAIEPFITVLHGTSKAMSLADALAAICAGGNHHALIQGAAILNLRDYRKAEQLVGPLTDPLPTQVATAQSALATNQPFLVSYYNGSNVAAGVGTDAMDALSARDRHALVDAEDAIDVEDAYFRMLQPHEVGRGMAFPGEYVVLGTNRDKVKQYGNAVTPPAMEILLQRCVDSLTGRRVA